jgi:hypothetical protein
MNRTYPKNFFMGMKKRPGVAVSRYSHCVAAFSCGWPELPGSFLRKALKKETLTPISVTFYNELSAACVT